ncbi:MAG: hypothetical protein A2189_00690 [Paenibacillus sp. RIFOXYA1_FULL_44_5]|nr:MAG: hypothetical protein A2189_00690 [Paenibacillus sp. RIFOXYA1_FULL_44_5]
MKKEEKEIMVSKIQQYFELERSEEIGHLAAENLLDFFIKEIGPLVYNQAIDEAQKLVTMNMLRLDEDMYALKKLIKRQAL